MEFLTAGVWTTGLALLLALCWGIVSVGSKLDEIVKLLRDRR